MQFGLSLDRECHCSSPDILRPTHKGSEIGTDFLGQPLPRDGPRSPGMGRDGVEYVCKNKGCWGASTAGSNPGV